MVQQLQKHRPPDQQQSHQHHGVLGVEGPARVGARGHEYPLKGPLGNKRGVDQLAQQDHGRQRNGNQPGERPGRRAAGQPQVRQQAGGPKHRQRVGEIGQRQNGRRGGQTPGLPFPRQSQDPEAQPETQIETEEAHVENPTVSQHGDDGHQVPGAPARHRGDKRKRAPDECQDREGNGDPLRRSRAHNLGQPA